MKTVEQQRIEQLFKLLSAHSVFSDCSDQEKNNIFEIFYKSVGVMCADDFYQVIRHFERLHFRLNNDFEISSDVKSRVINCFFKFWKKIPGKVNDLLRAFYYMGITWEDFEEISDPEAVRPWLKDLNRNISNINKLSQLKISELIQGSLKMSALIQGLESLGLWRSECYRTDVKSIVEKMYTLIAKQFKFFHRYGTPRGCISVVYRNLFDLPLEKYFSKDQLEKIMSSVEAIDPIPLPPVLEYLYRGVEKWLSKENIAYKPYGLAIIPRLGFKSFVYLPDHKAIVLCNAEKTAPQNYHEKQQYIQNRYGYQTIQKIKWFLEKPPYNFKVIEITSDAQSFEHNCNQICLDAFSDILKNQSEIMHQRSLAKSGRIQSGRSFALAVQGRDPANECKESKTIAVKTVEPESVSDALVAAPKRVLTFSDLTWLNDNFTDDWIVNVQSTLVPASVTRRPRATGSMRKMGLA